MNILNLILSAPDYGDTSMSEIVMGMIWPAILFLFIAIPAVIIHNKNEKDKIKNYVNKQINDREDN